MSTDSGARCPQGCTHPIDRHRLGTVQVCGREAVTIACLDCPDYNCQPVIEVNDVR